MSKQKQVISQFPGYGFSCFNGGHSLKFSRRIPGPSHEASSQGFDTRDWLGSFQATDGPSPAWLNDGPVGEEISAKEIPKKLIFNENLSFKTLWVLRISRKENS